MQLDRNEKMGRMKEIEEYKHMEGRKKSNEMDGSCWKLDESNLDRKGGNVVHEGKLMNITYKFTQYTYIMNIRT